MTGQALLTKAIALFNETDTEYYHPTALSAINLLLAETFDINNNILRSAGKSLLNEVPEISKLSEEIPYHDRLVKTAFPYGLAAKLYAGKREPSLLSYFHQQYVDALKICNKGFVRVVV